MLYHDYSILKRNFVNSIHWARNFDRVFPRETIAVPFLILSEIHLQDLLLNWLLLILKCHSTYNQETYLCQLKSILKSFKLIIRVEDFIILLCAVKQDIVISLTVNFGLLRRYF